ncbi:ParB/RepB/Spo0J family partition protein [Muricauda sp. TY007]|uniref:ParB/RepB/Spo0J family partition protein n=1 Tax=Allomuricauda sp. TY007 TaxID=2683200 RepID=UPI0013C135C2|nr:ParB/RepB/Spo0J family partition protein [Muricauda sp. TY007]NDV15724.1 ParB/RepB/Spo0J family partition protein [Muricauda sp. TY007]
METKTKQKATRKTAARKKASPVNTKTNVRKDTPLQVQDLDLASIAIDPDQPRKTLNGESLKQLAQSIKEYGVLQPITVRKTGKNFIIVMGERRFRASKLAGLKTIPAIVREYADNDVLEVQIIENLQRKDVEPTEEAEAIAFLTDRYDPTEIAKRLGRSENFVRQRLKLAGLIEGFKAFVKNGEMSLGLGVAVALFEPGEQQMMLESLEGKFNANQVKRMVDNQTFDLSKAPFDLSDDKLLPKAGACTLCPFNAANQGNLFGEGHMVCTRTACFENKKTKTLMNLIERAKKEGFRLVPKIRYYWKDEERNQLFIAHLEEQGFTVHLPDELEIIEKPMEPTLESIKEKYHYRDLNEEELQQEFDQAMQEHMLAQERFDTASDHGFENGFFVHTDSYHTEEIFVKVRETADEEDDHALPLEKRKMDECTPEEQIVKINGREERKKEIENNKLFEEVVQMVRETEYIDMDKPLSTDEMAAFAISLYQNNIGHHDQSQHFQNFFGDTGNMSREEIVAHFRKDFKEATLNRLIRFLLTRQVHFGESNHTNDWTNISFYSAMKEYHKADIEAIETRFDKDRKKREKRMKERIKELQQQVKALKG